MSGRLLIDLSRCVADPGDEALVLAACMRAGEAGEVAAIALGLVEDPGGMLPGDVAEPATTCSAGHRNRRDELGYDGRCRKCQQERDRRRNATLERVALSPERAERRRAAKRQGARARRYFGEAATLGCPQCGEMFHTKPGLAIHQGRVHG